MSVYLLVTTLIKHVGLFVAAAFILLTLFPVRQISLGKENIPTRMLLVAFFGLFGIMGTYGGNPIFDSFANLRAMAVITGGLYAGPVVGLGAGLIAGGHRFLIDIWGFSALPCAIATIIEGLAAGMISLRLRDLHMSWKLAVILAVIGETFHMLLVLALARPYAEALALVRLISVPMIVGNALGAALFVQLINLLTDHRLKRDSSQAQKMFAIASQTLSHLRGGLNMESALATARIIRQRLPVAAVSITDETCVLSHVGLGSDHHRAGKAIRTQATRQVLDTGTPIHHKRKILIGCNHPDCPFYSAIIVPLKKGGTIVGTLKLYGTREIILDRLLFEVAKGLTDLFSLQLELEDIQIKDRLLAHAEIRHLQAQINPHFLFNSLNTIASFCRTRPEKARELILDLSLYMRKNLDASRGVITLADELAQINSYLAIETARFGDRITTRIDVEEGCDTWPIPSLIIQPLVENAIRHGIAPREEGGTVHLTITRDPLNPDPLNPDQLNPDQINRDPIPQDQIAQSQTTLAPVTQNQETLKVEVSDDGVGIPAARQQAILDQKELAAQKGGVGLRNCVLRLQQIYGPASRVKVISSPGRGTTISFNLPKPKEK